MPEFHACFYFLSRLPKTIFRRYVYLTQHHIHINLHCTRIISFPDYNKTNLFHHIVQTLCEKTRSTGLVKPISGLKYEHP